MSNSLQTYPGRKGAAGTWQRIISEIPRCELFIDTMCGSALISSMITGCKKIINDIDPAVINRVRDCNKGAAGITFSNWDYRTVISSHDGPQSNVFYFDPPYKFSTRSYQQNIYKFEWDDLQHSIFLDRIRLMKSPAMVSHYPDQQYYDALKDWRVIEYKTMTRAGLRDECLWMNYPQPVLLQCYKHIGENFTDRQRIKRKVARMAAKLSSESDQERAAILSAIIDQFTYITEKKSL